MQYRHLDDEERERITHMKKNGKSQRAMARELNRSPTTISRERKRNRYPTDRSYKVVHAGSMARGRRRRARHDRRPKDPLRAHRKAGEPDIERLRHLICKHPHRLETITSDNGCEFHGYRDLEDRCGATFYFAHPYHSWERVTNAKTKGLIRQCLLKGCCMDDPTQARCNSIAKKLIERPRKRHGLRSPAELFDPPIDLARHS